MMPEHNQIRLIKAIVLGVFVFSLTLASFGLGVSVGSHNPSAFGATPASAAALPPAVSSADQVIGGDSETPLIDMVLVKEVWDMLGKQFYGELPKGKEVTYDAIRGIVDRLGDQHTGFADPQAAALSKDLEGHFEGIGAGVEKADGVGVRLNYLYPDQPAVKAGLLAGDIITAVDGKDISRLGLTEAIGMIRGPAGSQLTLTIRREGMQAFDVVVTRARIEIPTVTTKTLADGKVAYIALSEFSSVAPGRLAEAVRAALDKNPTGLVLDLRGNPGGYLDAAVRIGSYFVPEGNILIERFKDESERIYQRQGSYLLGKTPLVVLVDGGSASASEIVAGAIQDAGTGVLLGERTYGKGSVQLVNALQDGSQLRVTVARWFTPGNRGIHKSGLEPDIEVQLTKEDVQALRDAQLDRAVEFLLGDRKVPAKVTPTPTPTSTLRPNATPQGTPTP